MTKPQLVRSDYEESRPSRKPRRPQPKLKRALARGVEIEYLDASTEHIGNCWIAAQQGAFKGIAFSLSLADINQREFGECLIEALEEIANAAVLAFVPYEDGRRAVAMFIWYGDDRHIYPSVIWFPWASPRNKLEAALAFVNSGRLGDKKVHMHVPKDERNERFLRQLCLYGMMRKCGVVEDHYGKGKPAVYAYSREKWVYWGL